MAQQTINVGTAPNDGTGTPLRTAFQYTNSNFSELYTAVGPSGNNIVVPGNATITGALAANADTTLGTASKSTNTNLNLSSDLGTQRIYLDRGTRSLVFQDVTSSIENYRIAGITGVHTWGVGGSTAMTLNSTGLGIGGGPSGALDVRGTNSLTYDTSGNLYGLANIGTKGTSGGNLVIQTASATSTFGSALVIDGTYSGLTSTIRFRALGVNSAAYGSQISFSTTASGTIIERMLIDPSGNVGIGVTPAGTGGCLQLKSGITFPATQVASSDANTLDDYEEGTFTGTLKGSVSDPTTTVTATGRYTKIGRVVTVQIEFNNVSTVGASGNASVIGLPFTNSNAAGCVGSVISFSGLTFTETLSCIVGGASSTVDIYSVKSNSSWVAATHNAGTGRYLWINVTYTV